MAVVLPDTQLRAQHRVPFRNSGGQPAGARSGSQSRPAQRPVSSPAPGRADMVRPVSQFTEEPVVSGGVGGMETELVEHDPLDADCGCSGCGGLEADGMAECGACLDPCRSCLFGGWVQGEYLMWWPRAMQIPALVTSGTQASEGVLGAQARRRWSATRCWTRCIPERDCVWACGPTHAASMPGKSTDSSSGKPRRAKHSAGRARRGRLRWLGPSSTC